MTASLRFDGPGVRLDAIEIAKGEGASLRERRSSVGFDILLQRGRPADPGRGASRSFPIPEGPIRNGGAVGKRERHVRRASQRLPVPRPRSGGSRRNGRTGHRRACAARHRSERPDRRGVAAAVGNRHGAGLPRSGGRLGGQPAVPRQLVRSSMSACSCRTSRRPRPRSRAARYASRARSPTSRAWPAEGTIDTLDVRLFDYAVRNAAPIRLALNQGRVTSSRSAAPRRRHASSRHRHGGSGRRSHRAAGDGRREPRHPPGVLPRRARVGARRADCSRSTARCDSRCFRVARRLPRAVSAISPSRMRSIRSTARWPSTTGASASTT